MYYTYILFSKSYNKVYIGSTEDLKRRFVVHNNGNVKSTKAYQPWEIVYYEAHRSKMLSRRAEMFYKSSQGRRQIKKKLELT